MFLAEETESAAPKRSNITGSNSLPPLPGVVTSGIKPKKEPAKPLCSLWFGCLPALPFKQEILKGKGAL